jgi:hypothetical protein
MFNWSNLVLLAAAALLVWFIVSLVLFIKRDKTDIKQCNRRKVMLILSAVLCFTVIGAIIALILLVMAFLASM